MRWWARPGFWLSLAVVVVAALLPATTGSASAREAVFTILVSVALASSLNMLLGYAGYVSFGHIVFFGLGGYVGFYAVSVHGWHLSAAVLAGAAASGVLALLLGMSILRLRGAYFALATIGINEAMKALATNLDAFGGSTGMEMHLRAYQPYGGAARALWITYWALCGVTVLAVVASFLVKRSRFGLALLTIREDEDAAAVLGVDATRAKTLAYVLSAVFPGAVGALYFFKSASIEPGGAFRLHFSIELLVMIMLGGQGTLLGPILGAAAYQKLRSTLLTSAAFRDVQLVVAGALLLAIVLFVPAGAVGWLRSRSRLLHKALE
ncbi:MAG: branched-chain amino acid ABC transporter permease [Planctomycetota bacterium]